jgi:hypothetical protein
MIEILNNQCQYLLFHFQAKEKSDRKKKVIDQFDIYPKKFTYLLNLFN